MEAELVARLVMYTSAAISSRSAGQSGLPEHLLQQIAPTGSAPQMRSNVTASKAAQNASVRPARCSKSATEVRAMVTATTKCQPTVPPRVHHDKENYRPVSSNKTRGYGSTSREPSNSKPAKYIYREPVLSGFPSLPELGSDTSLPAFRGVIPSCLAVDTLAALRSESWEEETLREAQENRSRRPLESISTVLIPLDPRGMFSDLEEIGRGAHSIVYRARPAASDLASSTFVVLRSSTPSDPAELELFEREARLMRALPPHRNILQCYMSCLWQNQVWSVMEYVSGGSLYEQLKHSRTAFSDRYLATILRELVAALVHLHATHIIHRDVKSDNILVSEDGSRLKLCDFGFATRLPDAKSSRHAIVGTPYWMAPELIRGEDYDCAVDIWSAGVVIIECISGAPLYTHHEPATAMLLIARHGAAPALKDLDEYFEERSPSLRDFVHRCLRSDPRRRPTAQQLLKHDFLKLVD